MRVSAVVVAALALAPAALGSNGLPQDGSATRSQELGSVRIYNIQYRSHTGTIRSAYVVLPRWYSPSFNPSLKVVISPHGRGLDGRKNARLFGQLPARGPFLLISPDGQGRRLPGGYSWGSPGQIEDLARMPRLVQAALPWLRLNMKQVFAFGGSMGGQETLLLLARHPRLLAGAAAFDAVSDFALQYRSFKHLRCNATCLRDLGQPLGRRLQLLARAELGGTPWNRPLAFALRSPITYARAIAASCVPLQLWWSPADRVVVDQQKQSGKLFWKLRGLNKNAPIGGYVGFWIHSREMKASTKLPYALRQFGLLPRAAAVDTTDLHVVPAPRESCARG